MWLQSQSMRASGIWSHMEAEKKMLQPRKRRKLSQRFFAWLIPCTTPSFFYSRKWTNKIYRMGTVQTKGRARQAANLSTAHPIRSKAFPTGSALPWHDATVVFDLGQAQSWVLTFYPNQKLVWNLCPQYPTRVLYKVWSTTTLETQKMRLPPPPPTSGGRHPLTCSTSHQPAGSHPSPETKREYLCDLVTKLSLSPNAETLAARHKENGEAVDKKTAEEFIVKTTYVQPAENQKKHNILLLR